MVKKTDKIEDPNVSSRLTITTLFGFGALVIIIKVMWDLTVPDLFPGAVAEGLVVETLNWWTAIKLSLFITFIMGLVNWIQSGGAFRFKE